MTHSPRHGSSSTRPRVSNCLSGRASSVQPHIPAESETLAPEQSSLCTRSPLPSCLESDGGVPACRPYYRAYHLQKGSSLACQAVQVLGTWTAPSMQTRLSARWIGSTLAMAESAQLKYRAGKQNTCCRFVALHLFATVAGRTQPRNMLVDQLRAGRLAFLNSSRPAEPELAD